MLLQIYLLNQYYLLMDDFTIRNQHPTPVILAVDNRAINDDLITWTGAKLGSFIVDTASSYGSHLIHLHTAIWTQRIFSFTHLLPLRTFASAERHSLLSDTNAFKCFNLFTDISFTRGVIMCTSQDRIKAVVVVPMSITSLQAAIWCIQLLMLPRDHLVWMSTWEVMRCRCHKCIWLGVSVYSLRVLFRGAVFY